MSALIFDNACSFGLAVFMKFLVFFFFSFYSNRDDLFYRISIIYSGELIIFAVHMTCRFGH